MWRVVHSILFNILHSSHVYTKALVILTAVTIPASASTMVMDGLIVDWPKDREDGHRESFIRAAVRTVDIATNWDDGELSTWPLRLFAPKQSTENFHVRTRMSKSVRFAPLTDIHLIERVEEMTEEEKQAVWYSVSPRLLLASTETHSWERSRFLHVIFPFWRAADSFVFPSHCLFNLINERPKNIRPSGSMRRQRYVFWCFSIRKGASPLKSRSG